MMFVLCVHHKYNEITDTMTRYDINLVDKSLSLVNLINFRIR